MQPSQTRNFPSYAAELQDWHLDQNTQTAIETLFQSAYQARYSAAPQPGDLAAARAQLNRILKAL